MADEQRLFLERLTSPEIGEAIRGGKRRVIVACGAVEQHGPHLPLFTDAEHGTRLAYEVALRLGDALVAPTIRIGCSEHHMAFPGSLTLRASTFEAVCHDYATSLARHGFDTICFLPTHGGNFRPLGEMLPRLREAVAPEARVLAFADLLGLIGLWTRIVEEEAGLGERVGGHADIAESSVMLALHPELVRVERAEKGFSPELEEDAVARILAEGFEKVTPNGILGDARGMSAALGERLIAAAADLAAAGFGD